MSEKIDRIGEKRLNTFGSKMIIKEYRNCSDIDVYFPKYNWEFKNATYSNFKKGQIKCPFDLKVYGKGCIGEGNALVSINGKNSDLYILWKNMLKRCYSDVFHRKQPTYKGCTVCDEWLNFQVFAKWYEDNYYEIPGERMCLDKDIIIKGNRIYSPETCVFVPQRINILFVKHDKLRGEYPIGISYHKGSGKFRASCSDVNKRHIVLGNFDNPIDAFNEYKRFKELIIKEMADEYKDLIPDKLYNAMYKYEVEITD